MESLFYCLKSIPLFESVGWSPFDSLFQSQDRKLLLFLNRYAKASKIMSVHFVYRSGYEKPLGHRLKTFDDRDMLAWFQRNWLRIEDVPSDLVEWYVYTDGREEPDIDFEFLSQRTDSILGQSVYGFESVWTSMVQNAMPQSSDELVEWLKSTRYPEGEIFARTNAFQACTDDDERDLVVMMFDDSFAAAHPERVALFLHNQLDLPTDAGTDKRFEWPGKSVVLNSNQLNSNQPDQESIYCIFVVLEDSAWLSPPKGVFQLTGIQLNMLAEELRKPVELNHPKWPSELRMLRSVAFSNPEMSTGELFAKFIEARPFVNAPLFDAWESGKRNEKRFLGDQQQMVSDQSAISERLKQKIDSESPKHSFQISDHFVRIGFHDDDLTDYQNSCHLAMYFFDDRWAQANPHLATSLLYYGSEGLCLFDLKTSNQ